jgi:hypothetical protein
MPNDHLQRQAWEKQREIKTKVFFAQRYLRTTQRIETAKAFARELRDIFATQQE